MKGQPNAFWIIAAALLVIAVAALFPSYWPVAVGLAIVIIALLISRAPVQGSATQRVRAFQRRRRCRVSV